MRLKRDVKLSACGRDNVRKAGGIGGNLEAYLQTYLPIPLHLSHPACPGCFEATEVSVNRVSCHRVRKEQ
jgi:hypothetical protein